MHRSARKTSCSRSWFGSMAAVMTTATPPRWSSTPPNWRRQGIIVVCIQYRVNLFGFLALPELSAENEEGVSGNYGTLDQIKALEWVNENIEGFGGDPENVTICGQSAGAMSVTALLSTDMTDGLFNRAIIQSGFGGYAAPGNYKSLADKEETCQNAIEKAFGEDIALEELSRNGCERFPGG